MKSAAALMQGNLVWLSSYPKSGNTWLRALLSHLILPHNETIELNNLVVGRHAASRSLVEQLEHICASELLPDELSEARISSYHQLAIVSPEMHFLKVHDDYCHLADGRAMFPVELSRGVIHIVRNPLDVAVSLSHHLSVPIEVAVSHLNEGLEFATEPGRLFRQLPQVLSNWSEHVGSWINQKDIPILVIRFEDLLESAEAELAKVIDFLKLDFDFSELERAAQLSRFERLQRRETESGFFERPAAMRRFFRSGKAGQWKRVLPSPLVDRVLAQHGQMMTEFGYF